MDEDPSALPPGTLIGGKFRVRRCMGVGGMGAVYEIEHELTKHRRALKLLHAAMAQMPGVVERFLREASAAGRVGNPHIVESFDAGTLDTGEPYLVMEMLRGETLSSRIERGPMPVSEVVDLIGQACDGIQAAHDAGIVHRDLKPDNLFVTDVDGHPFVKILDFGISKFDPGKIDGRALTQEGAALGTPYYMSAEQIRGETTIDARTDVYALGVILYECLAGVRPFDAETLTQLAILIHTGKPKPIGEHRKDLPPGFAAIVETAMASDRQDRTPSAQKLREELERYGAVSFRGRASMVGAPASTTAAPATVTSGAASAAAARSVAPRALGTSAAGVSMADARKKSSQSTPIFAGFAILAGVAAGAFILRSKPETASPEPVASAISAPPSHAAAVPPPPVVPPPPAPSAVPPPAPVASAAPSAAPPVSQGAPARPSFPVVAPTLQQPAPPPPAAAPPAATAAAPPAAPERKPRRTEEKGLAKDNPFR